MYKSQALLRLLSLAAFAFVSHAANATVFTINCGAAGPTTALQAQITSIGSAPGHQINVLGTCVGDVDTSRADRLTIAGLSLTGSLTMQVANSLRFTNLTIDGSISLLNTRNTT